MRYRQKALAMSQGFFIPTCSLRLATCNLLQFIHHLLHPPRIRMQIAGCGGETGVPQHRLEGHQIAVLQLIVIYFTPWGETNDRLLPVSTTHDS